MYMCVAVSILLLYILFPDSHPKPSRKCFANILVYMSIYYYSCLGRWVVVYKYLPGRVPLLVLTPEYLVKHPLTMQVLLGHTKW